MFAYCLGCAFVGMIGLGGDPSVSVVDWFGFWAAILYSSILVVCGTIGAIGIFRSLQATVRSLWGIAGATFFQGVAVFASGSPQVGLRLIVAPLMMVPLAWVWVEWLTVVRKVSSLKVSEIVRRKHGGS